MNKKLAKDNKRKRKIQAKLFLKPALKREIVNRLPIFLAIMLIIDCFFTLMAGDSHIKLCQNRTESKISEMQHVIERANNRYDESLDYSQYEMHGENAIASSGDEEMDQKLTTDLGGFQFKASMPDIIDFSGLFDTIFYTTNYIFDKGFAYFAAPLRYESVALCNTNGDSIVQKQYGIFLPVKDESKSENKLTIYVLDESQMESAYPGLYRKIEDMVNPAKNGGYYVDFKFEDIYYKGNYVIPKKINFYKYGKTRYNGEYPEDETEGELIETIDLSECDFSEYKPLQDTDDYVPLNPIITGTKNSATNIANAVPSKELVLEAIENEKTGKVLPQECIWSGKYKCRGYKFEKTANDTLLLYVAYHYDFYSAWKGILFGFYILVFVCMSVILFIVAKKSFLQKKVAYELYAYRKKVTDAMAHDLKSPLMAISGYAENLSGTLQNEKEKRYSLQILETVKNMDAMIQNILELSKLEEQKVTLDKKEIALEQLTQEELLKYSDKLQEKSLSVEIEGTCALKCDENWMRHLVDNLLSNAVKYAKESTQITIMLQSNQFAIKNEYANAIEIDKEALVQPFVKGDNARNNTQGNGLGLSIVQNIASMHGYTMDISAEEQVFTVSIHF